MKTILILSAFLSTSSFADMAFSGDRFMPFNDVWCEAHTVCQSGRTIRCNSHDPSCTSHENPGVNVECIAYDLPNDQGGWHKAWDSCP